MICDNNFKWLHFRQGHFEIVECLVKSKARIDSRGFKRFTPLHLACHYGHSNIVEVLIKYGANVDAKNDENWTALQLASCSGNLEIWEYLIRHAQILLLKELLLRERHYFSFSSLYSPEWNLWHCGILKWIHHSMLYLICMFKIQNPKLLNLDRLNKLTYLSDKRAYLNSHKTLIWPNQFYGKLLKRNKRETESDLQLKSNTLLLFEYSNRFY